MDNKPSFFFASGHCPECRPRGGIDGPIWIDEAAEVPTEIWERLRGMEHKTIVVYSASETSLVDMATRLSPLVNIPVRMLIGPGPEHMGEYLAHVTRDVLEPLEPARKAKHYQGPKPTKADWRRQLKRSR